ncbi:hypothetical protein J4734_25775 [Klebsiella pneumoniae]|uniref:Uncharacterized protein n=1 Tax=Klebsiella pneumoniae TaxID=573 RepID=A0A939NNP3_KLEPN|nr:hypothetical protein [Klebsiella pneumoniae]
MVAFAIGDGIVGVFVRHVSTWRIIVSVAQADEVIIARYGDKSKMSIGEKPAEVRTVIW